MDEEEQLEHPWLPSRPTVGAVLVAHQGGRWLPQVLASLADMEYAPTAWRVVDVGSTDRGADLLRDSFGADRMIYAGSGTGFGEAVRLGVEALPPTDWIWLLHDDAAVQSGTLAGLLDEATTADDIAVVGPKVREWPSLKRLLEVGLTITSTGARETGLETGEPDAGQHDWARDVLAVNSAGMLVRRKVWEELGGFDPELPLFFDDIDFGWRVARAGYRTRTAPRGIIFHAEASRRRVRPHAVGDPKPWEARHAALHTILTNTTGARAGWQSVRLFLGAMLRVLGFLVAKDPESAGDELQAVRAVYGHPRRIRAARRRKAEQARRGHREVRHLLAPFWLPYRHALDAVLDVGVALVRPETSETVGRRSTAPVLGNQDPDDDDLEDGPSLLRRRPWLVTVLLLVVASFVAGRGLFGGLDGASLLGGALPASPDTAGGWWQLMVERSHDVGLGASGFAPTFAGLLAVVATPVWFGPGLVVSALMLFSVPLAGLTAHRLGRILTPHRPTRIVWAAGYALAVVATGAVAQGRIGTVVALIVLPVVVNTALQLAERPRWQVALRLGIWWAVATAFAPVVLPIGLVGLLVLAVARRVSWRDVGITLVVTLLLLGPWTWQRAAVPWRWWWEAGYALSGQATVRDVLLGRAGGPGAAPEWLGATLLVLAVLALVPQASRPAVLRSWLVAVVGLAFAVLGVTTTSTLPGGGQLVPWVGVPVVVWVAGLGTAVLLAARELVGAPRRLLVPVTVLALVLPLGTAAWWLGRGVEDPLQRARPDVVPVFLTARPGDVLVLRGTIADGVSARVVHGAGPYLGQEALDLPRGRSRDVQDVVESLLTRPDADDVKTLASVGIDSVYAPDVDPDLEGRVDAAPLLERAGSDSETSRVWTLAVPASQEEPEAARWRWISSVVLAVLWVAALVLTAPVRRRRVEPTFGEEVDA
ncbi:hypothetical protein ASD11_02445 [Aeromicrobium sp. Root495]|uniref:glycosyltransferase n=1 Tax=Aeromicrobium sp. Root495 TaxID=1736550 RepID=UPI0006F22067|nr:glycosyltransferase family 2 protein [Aeromicrobium sp. Root495]KQY58539.1 hypothetical protein ASD11_02445 [Aeromicrobium sp. Root495]